MSYSVETIEEFDKQLKALAKKYSSLRQEYAALIDQLETDPVSVADAALGKGCYKIRMAIASKGTGKSGGARVVYYVSIINDTVYLLSVFDKADAENIPAKEIERLRARAVLKVIPGTLSSKTGKKKQ